MLNRPKTDKNKKLKTKKMAASEPYHSFQVQLWEFHLLFMQLAKVGAMVDSADVLTPPLLHSTSAVPFSTQKIELKSLLGSFVVEFWMRISTNCVYVYILVQHLKSDARTSGRGTRSQNVHSPGCVWGSCNRRCILVPHHHSCEG